MDNTLSHHGLSYSHPGYAPHHPNHAPHLMQQTAGAHTAMQQQSHAQTPYSAVSSSGHHQSSAPSRFSAPPPPLPYQPGVASHSSNLTQHNAAGVHNNPPNLGLPIHMPTRSMASTNSSNLYPQTSVYVNPYMGVPLSPSSHSPHPHLSHHPPAAAHPHMHPHPYIAPPPGFTHSHQQMSQPVSSSSSYSSVALNAASATPASSHLPVSSSGYSNTSAAAAPPAEGAGHAYAGLVPGASGAMVPYNYSPQLHPGYPAGMYPGYRYPAASSGWCPPPPSQYPSVDTDLLTKLEDTHLSYLNTEDSPDKLELRKHMDELIKRLVSVTPHNLKFSFPGVCEVLESSVQQQSKFDAFKAASAFDALASYAANLVVQPWRHEYRTIKLYSGYWVHKVAEHLHNGETILRLIGYIPYKSSKSKKGDEAGDSVASVGCYQLPASIIDVDVVSRLALDCHIACCECQVLGQLRNEFPQLSYQQLLQYRQLSVGSCEDVAQRLLHFLKPASSATAASTNTTTTTATSSTTTGAASAATKSTTPVGDTVMAAGRGESAVDGATGAESYRRHSGEALASRGSEKQPMASSCSRTSSYDVTQLVPPPRLESSVQTSRMMDEQHQQQQQLARLAPKSYNLQTSSSSKSSLDSESWSPKKALLPLPPPAVSASSSSASDQAVVARLLAATSLPQSMHGRSGRAVNTSLPSTPTTSNSILDRIHADSSVMYATDNSNTNNEHSKRGDPLDVPWKSSSDKYYFSSSNDRLPTTITGDKSSDERPGAGDTAYSKSNSARFIQEQLDSFIDTSRDRRMVPRTNKYQHGRLDDPQGSVATAQLIDHEEQLQQLQGAGGGRQQPSSRADCGPDLPPYRLRDTPSHSLPKVLPHLRSSSKSQRGGLTESGGGVLPSMDPAPAGGGGVGGTGGGSGGGGGGDSCSLPRNIPIELFASITLAEHLQESYNLLKETSRAEAASRKSQSNGPSYKDTWGFVMQDLEKKGYNKDVGNRGDILHHLTNSKSSTSNLATNSAPNATVTVVPNSGSKLGLLGEGEMVPELIPSTVQNVKKELLADYSLSNSHNRGVLNMVEALDQITLHDAATARGRGTAGLLHTAASGSSTTRNRSKGGGVADGDYYPDKYSQYSSSNEKYSSDGGSEKRNSVYDNVSYGGFETARQDTDEDDEDGRKRRRGSGRDGSTSYAQACSNGARYQHSGGGGGGQSGKGEQTSTNRTAAAAGSGGAGPPIVGLSNTTHHSNSSNSSNSSSRYMNASESTVSVQGGGGKASSNKSSSSRRSPLGTLSSKLTRELQHSKESNNTYDTNTKSKNNSNKSSKGNESSKPWKSGGGGSEGSKPMSSWSCVSCTFFNETSPSVCEMCSRSRQLPGAAGIRPLETGGRHCDQCTLINEKDADTCSACGFKLETCPTYI